MSAPPSSTEISASLLSFGHMQRSYGYLCDSIRSHHEGVVLFIVSVPSPQGSSVSLCRSYLILHLDFSVLDSIRCHRRSRGICGLWFHSPPFQSLSRFLLQFQFLFCVNCYCFLDPSFNFELFGF
ncbi:uncharacterized protein DS421_19g666120 [Arachis hypogaea]|uniref:Uncharacterized protein n=1 Tax=Arachis hypogaea TaxID=3818 RepID=A0A6B9VBN8_ARAHY|nr:uncharacterized protein DS421_19g666120 [Arachis hypogaea]